MDKVELEKRTKGFALRIIAFRDHRCRAEEPVT
jgi:hypothetical protein